MLQFVDDDRDLMARIRVVGVGGGGGNAVNTMIESGLRNVEFIAANTDAQALRNNLATTKIQLGVDVTYGLGAGADPELGMQAALANEDQIREHLAGADMVFVTAGMGGGTGTGAAPVVARVASELGALTVGVVTKPFGFEGKVRMRNAELGLSELRKQVDTLIVIPNERIFTVVKHGAKAEDAFRVVDDVLNRAVKGISDIITRPGKINLDFADVKRVMKARGRALMGTGIACGEERAVEAAQLAISSPLLEDNSIAGAMGVLINITGSRDIGIYEIQKASKVVQESVHEDAEIIVGLGMDDGLGEELMVTVIATGFEQTAEQREPEAPTDWVGRPEDRSRPAYQRRPAEAAAPSGTAAARRAAFALVEDEEEFEIPAFLRRQAD